MKKIGGKSEKGQGFDDLLVMKKAITAIHPDTDVEVHFLNSHWAFGDSDPQVLVWRKAVGYLLPAERDADKALTDLSNGVGWDKKQYSGRYNKVSTSIARYNVCVGDFSSSADDDEKQGTILDFNDADNHLLQTIRRNLPLYLGEKALGLFADIINMKDFSSFL
jgi:hypothetical protein